MCLASIHHKKSHPQCIWSRDVSVNHTLQKKESSTVSLVQRCLHHSYSKCQVLQTINCKLTVNLPKRSHLQCVQSRQIHILVMSRSPTMIADNLFPRCVLTIPQCW